MNRKSQTQYISWILIFGLVMMLSYLLYTWSIEQARERSLELETRTDPLVCAEVGISVEGVCQTYNTLEVNITNTGNLELEGLTFRFVGIYPEKTNYLQAETIFERVKTEDSKRLKVLKQGISSQVSIIPVTKKKNKNIYCENQGIVKEQGDLKQC